MCYEQKKLLESSGVARYEALELVPPPPLKFQFILENYCFMLCLLCYAYAYLLHYIAWKRFDLNSQIANLIRRINLIHSSNLFTTFLSNTRDYFAS